MKVGGYKVDVFTDPFQALERIKSEHQNYVLVLTDVKMPNISGINLGKKILEVDNEIKIILISAFELMEATQFQYVKKPIELTELSEVVRKKLNGKT